MFRLENTIFAPFKAPFLLGLSGGGDSMALFHLLLDAKISFHVAHLDHGWREESKKEAEILQRNCLSKEVPFHQKCCSNLPKTEEAGRLERLSFFKKIIQEEALSALLLAHHANDQQETVLKRMFEGANLDVLGMRAKTKWEGMTILRPLLHLPKEALIEYLKEKKVDFFQDPTNFDSRYLRGRLRSQILPRLQEDFGKNVRQGLSRIATHSAEWSAYLDRELLAKAPRVLYGPLGIWVRFSKELDPFLLKLWLRRFLRDMNRTLPNHLIEEVCTGLKKRLSEQRFQVGQDSFLISRGELFWPTPVSTALDPLILSPGNVSWGPWNVTVQRAPSFSPTCWRDGWEGSWTTFFSSDEALLAMPKQGMKIRSRSLGEWYRESLVPRWLRMQFPVILAPTCGSVLNEFLTGRCSWNLEEDQERFSVKIQLKSNGSMRYDASLHNAKISEKSS